MEWDYGAYEGMTPAGDPGRPARLAHLARRRTGGRVASPRSRPGRTRWWRGRAPPDRDVLVFAHGHILRPWGHAGSAAAGLRGADPARTRRPCRSSAGRTANRPSRAGTTGAPVLTCPAQPRPRASDRAARRAACRSRNVRRPPRPAGAAAAPGRCPPASSGSRDDWTSFSRSSTRIRRRRGLVGAPPRARSSASSAVYRAMFRVKCGSWSRAARRACRAARGQSPSVDQHCASRPSSSASP